MFFVENKGLLMFQLIFVRVSTKYRAILAWKFSSYIPASFRYFSLSVQAPCAGLSSRVTFRNYVLFYLLYFLLHLPQSNLEKPILCPFLSKYLDKIFSASLSNQSSASNLIIYSPWIINISLLDTFNPCFW